MRVGSNFDLLKPGIGQFLAILDVFENAGDATRPQFWKSGSTRAVENEFQSHQNRSRFTALDSTNPLILMSCNS